MSAAPSEPEQADWLLRVAFHEAGHAVAAWLLGGARAIVGPLTREERGSYAGIAYTAASRWAASDDASLDRVPFGAPVALWPARTRRTIEIRALVLLAGVQAEPFRTWPLTASEPAPRLQLTPAPSDAAESPLPAREAAMLAKSAASPSESDLSRAFSLAEALTGNGHEPGRADRLVEHWTAETAALIGSERSRRLLEPLGHELYERGTLPRARVVAILKETEAR